MATPYFQQQSAAYNLYQKQALHVFTPDGQEYVVTAVGKAHTEYVIEVQDHLMHFEMEAMLAQRDSLHDALVRRHVLQQFGAAGDPRFAGADLDSVSAELKRRGIAATTLKTAIRVGTGKVNGELKEIWPVRESGRSLQYTSYDLVFSHEEAGKAPHRQKIWEIVTAWARESRLPGKEGARLATVQEWDDLGDLWAIRVDLHHYPRPDLESCRPITLLEGAERNKDMEILRKALVKAGVELGEISVKPYAVPQTAPLREAEPPPPPPYPLVAPVADMLGAVRSERDKLEQQVRLLADAITDNEERLRQSQRIVLLEQHKADLEGLLRNAAEILNKLAWPGRPADWERQPTHDKLRLVAQAFEASLKRLGETQNLLLNARDKLNAAATKQQQTEDEVRLFASRMQAAERDRAKLVEELEQAQKSRDQWKERAESSDSNLRGELLKQQNAALLAQELEFTRQIQDMQQDFLEQTQEIKQKHMREIQLIQEERRHQIEEIQQEHIEQIQALQGRHLLQIQKLRRLAPSQEGQPDDEVWMPPPTSQRHKRTARTEPANPPPAPPAPAPSKLTSLASEISLYQSESQEIFDTRIGEYLRIAKDLGLSEADKWLLAESRKLAEARAKQGVLEI